MSFLIETFNQTTGKRCHYSHSEDKLNAIRDFLRIQPDIFKDLGEENQIICLVETIGSRAGMFNEGVCSMSISKVIAVKGLNVPPSKLSIISIKESMCGNELHSAPSIYLRQTA